MNVALYYDYWVWCIIKFHHGVEGTMSCWQIVRCLHAIKLVLLTIVELNKSAIWISKYVTYIHKNIFKSLVGCVYISYMIITA